jgi:hypothetical protein
MLGIMTAATEFVLNRNKLAEFGKFEQPGKDDFPGVLLKNKSVDEALSSSTDYCKSVIRYMLSCCRSYQKYQFIDIKVHDLNEGRQTANGLWHLDSSLNPVHQYENFLFVTGSLALTEFVENEITIPFQKDAVSFSRFIESQKKSIVRVKSCVVTKYDGTNVHRGPKSMGTERRLLIRLVNTNQRLPSSYL